MRRDDVLAILAAHRAELQAVHHVQTLALFGSVARDEARPDSDVDLLVAFDRPVGLFTLIGLQLYLEDVLGREVDLGTFTSLRESIRTTAEQDLVYVA